MSACQSATAPPFDHALDASGLRCPLPILRCKKALSTMRDGEILKVITTDAGATQDFPAFCKQTGHRLLYTEHQASSLIFFIQKCHNKL